MFLKRFKEKSNQKYLRKLLEDRATVIKLKKIETVGILLNFDEFNDYDVLKSFFKNLGIKDKNIKFIAYLNKDKVPPNSWDTFFYADDFGWRGKINNVSLNDFIAKNFDLLISYYNTQSYELNVVTALSKAHFKIGIANYDERLHDFIINIKTSQIEIFKDEVLKYLKVLKITR